MPAGSNKTTTLKRRRNKRKQHGRQNPTTVPTISMYGTYADTRTVRTDSIFVQ